VQGNPEYKVNMSDETRNLLSDTLKRWIDCDEALHAAMYLQYMTDEGKDTASSQSEDESSFND
jgi:hypothetical protein